MFFFLSFCLALDSVLAWKALQSASDNKPVELLPRRLVCSLCEELKAEQCRAEQCWAEPSSAEPSWAELSSAEPSRAKQCRAVSSYAVVYRCILTARHLCDTHLTSTASTFPCDVRCMKSWRSRAETLREPRRPLNAEECSSVKLMEGHSWLMWWRGYFCWCTMYRAKWALVSDSTGGGSTILIAPHDCTYILLLLLLLLLQAGKYWFLIFCLWFG